MANNCFYRMKIVGEKGKVDELIKALDDKSERFPDGVGRVFAVCIAEQDEKSATVEGDCAWSVNSAMYNLPKIIEELGLSVEVYSEELGMAFEEHYLYTDGVLDLEEVEDIYEFSIEDIESDESDFWENEIVKQEGITHDNYNEYFDDSDYIKVGGFGNWDFEI